MHVRAAVLELTLSDGWCCRGMNRLGGNWPRQDSGEHKSFHGFTSIATDPDWAR
jgi:hypothetical protein